jgi:hypothetical protein
VVADQDSAHGRCTHQPFPFAKIATKAEIAEPGRYIASFAAFSVVRVSIMTARDEDVQRERVMLSAHLFKDNL